MLPVLKKKVPASVNSQANLPAPEKICHTAEVKSQPALIGPCGHVTGHNTNREFGWANMT